MNPFARDGKVWVKWRDGYEWAVPGLIPQDLVKGKYAKEESCAKPKAAAEKSKSRPKVAPGTWKINYAKQGEENDPIVKLMVKKDTSGWAQKCQITIVGDMTKTGAENILKSMYDANEVAYS